MKKTCSKCGTENEVKLVKTYLVTNRHRPGWVGKQSSYEDERGRKSRGNLCHECHRKQQRRSCGGGPRDESTAPKVIKAIAAEVAAKEFFERLGFIVERTGCLGPDLRCKIGSIEWTVEVKRARPVEPKRYPNGSHVTDLVHRNRRKDDLVAIVLPNGRVYIDSMTRHLGATKACGQRTVTAIVKEFGLHPLKTA